MRDDSKETDTILCLLKDGNKKGLEMLFKKYYRPLVIYALSFLGDQAEAEDLVQDVFIRLWESNRFPFIDSYLHSYLYQSVKNTCLNWLGSKHHIIKEELDIIHNFSDSEIPDEDDWTAYLDKIYLEIENLPPRTREIFVAVYIGNKKYKEVAHEFNISVNTVKTALNRALSFLRKNLLYFF